MENVKTEENTAEILPLEDDQWLFQWSDQIGLKGEVKDEIICSNGAEAGKHEILEEELDETRNENTGSKSLASVRKINNKQGSNKQLTNRVDRLLKKICQEATVTERLSDMCLYECPECCRTFTKWRTIKEHRKKSHKCSVFLTELSRMMKKSVCHICKICSERLLCDNFFIQRHMMQKHKLCRDDYIKLAKLGCDDAEKISNPIGYQADKVVQKLCKEAEVSGLVANMCLYKCPDCGKILTGWRNLGSHLAKAHQAKVTLASFNSMLLTKTVCHECKICSERILCDIYFIKRHLEQKHKMHENEYNDKFGHNTSKTLPEDAYSENTIGNFCVFQCIKCKKKLQSKKLVSRHKCFHFQSTDHKNICSLTKRVYHTCKLCSKKLLCDRIILTGHFRYRHNLSTEEYSEKTGTSNTTQRRVPRSLLKSLNLSNEIGNICIFACNICNKKLIGYESFKGHVRKHKQKCHNLLPKCLLKGYSYQCKLCGKLMLCERSFIYSHMINVHGVVMRENMENAAATEKSKYEKLCKTFKEKTPISFTFWDRTVMPSEKVPMQERNSRIGNLVEYNCPKCDLKEINGWIGFVRHYKSVHCYDSDFTYSPSLLSVARCHICLICSKAILSDRYFVAKHVRKRHKMALQRYERIFIKNGGEVLPTFRQWKRSKLISFDEDMPTPQP